MKETLSKYRFFTPDRYDKEEQFLREMSLKGWHFRNFSFMKYTFEKGQPISYSYKLDFRKDINVEKENYITMYEDFGWEHLFEFKVFGGAWEYFRKESETGEEETLFTDNESKIDLLSRIQKFYIGIMIFMVAVNAANMFNVYHIIQRGSSIGVWLAVFWILVITFYIKIQVGISVKIDRLKRKK